METATNAYHCSVKQDDDFPDDPVAEAKYNLGRFLDDFEQFWKVDETYPDPTVNFSIIY